MKSSACRVTFNLLALAVAVNAACSFAGSETDARTRGPVACLFFMIPILS